MADDLGQSKTEAPSPRRREEARQQGRVARSPELSGGLLLLAGVLALWLGSRTFGGTLLDGLRLDLGEIQKTSFGLDDAQGFFASLLSRGLGLLGSFLGMIFVVSLAAGLMQVGFNVSPEILALNWERLSPAAGFGRLFSLASVVRGAVAVLKLGAASLVVYWVIKGRSSQIASTGHESVAQVATVAWDIAMRLALAIAAALVTIGLVDYIFQRWRHEQSLMMSRQEKKDETKQDEGDPHVRARIRKLQRESARKRMLADVPRASVVITNPTHLAIALRYDRGKMAAPKVVAKGAGFVAQRIVEMARSHAVPVVERKMVARALYKVVKVGQEIPSALYHAVAEILAYIMRLQSPMK